MRGLCAAPLLASPRSADARFRDLVHPDEPPGQAVMSKPTSEAAPSSHGTAGDSLETVDLLEDQFGRLRAACSRLADAERDLEVRSLALAVREREAAERVAAAEERERAAEAALDQVRRREAALDQKEGTLAEALESVRAREEGLQRIKARLDGLRQALGSMAKSGEAATEHRSEDLETLIASAVRRAADTQREADQMATRLQATEIQAAALQDLLGGAEQRAEGAEKERRALEMRLSEAQALCARVQSDAESLVGELRAEIKRMTLERDKAQARLDRQTARIERAGLQIQWDDVPKRQGKSK